MNKKGFTLIELLVVIAILGILAALITGNFFTSLKKGRDAKRKADLEQVTRALEMYYEDKRAYPIFDIFASPGYQLCGNGLVAPASSCAAGEKAYMLKMPNDPISGRSYEYLTNVTTPGVDFKLFACLENNLQMLPYVSSGYTMSCATSCNGTPGIPCVWGVSSSNISP
jgi:general secretion pathway protein G